MIDYSFVNKKYKKSMFFVGYNNKIDNSCFRYFELQLDMSKEFSLPLFLHCRNAAADLIEILKRYPNLKGVVHSFDGTLEEAQTLIKMNFLIGLNGWFVNEICSNLLDYSIWLFILVR